MSEYVFRYANGYGFDADDVEVVEYFAEENTGHYGTLHDEIVRCRDCRHHDETGNCLEMLVDVTPDGFCAWAVRKEGGE